MSSLAKYAIGIVIAVSLIMSIYTYMHKLEEQKEAVAYNETVTRLESAFKGKLEKKLNSFEYKLGDTIVNTKTLTIKRGDYTENLKGVSSITINKIDKVMVVNKNENSKIEMFSAKELYEFIVILEHEDAGKKMQKVYYKSGI